jgi:hypothetical protein
MNRLFCIQTGLVLGVIAAVAMLPAEMTAAAVVLYLVAAVTVAFWPSGTETTSHSSGDSWDGGHSGW